MTRFPLGKPSASPGVLRAEVLPIEAPRLRSRHTGPAGRGRDPPVLRISRSTWKTSAGGARSVIIKLESNLSQVLSLGPISHVWKAVVTWQDVSLFELIQTNKQRSPSVFYFLHFSENTKVLTALLHLLFPESLVKSVHSSGFGFTLCRRRMSNPTSRAGKL